MKMVRGSRKRAETKLKTQLRYDQQGFVTKEGRKMEPSRTLE